MGTQADETARQYRGRLAPTPSGFLHLGHARTFARAVRRARERGGKIILRIEDIDRERCKPEYAKAAIDDLRSAGFTWDEGPDVGGDFGPYVQSMRFELYRRALLNLIRDGRVYPCEVSRSRIREESYAKGTAQAARPKIFDDVECEPVFPLRLRNIGGERLARRAAQNPFSFNWRFAAREGERVRFCDGNFGEVSFEAQRDFGDFLVWRKCGAPSYELAVCADDAAMKITEVVRGADLLLSTARQLLLYRALGLNPPEFFHCPIMRDEGGKKISKSSMRESSAKNILIRNSPEAAGEFLKRDL